MPLSFFGVDNNYADQSGLGDHNLKNLYTANEHMIMLYSQYMVN
jgi:hypothetical protein